MFMTTRLPSTSPRYEIGDDPEHARTLAILKQRHQMVPWQAELDQIKHRLTKALGKEYDEEEEKVLRIMFSDMVYHWNDVANNLPADADDDGEWNLDFDPIYDEDERAERLQFLQQGKSEFDVFFGRGNFWKNPSSMSSSPPPGGGRGESLAFFRLSEGGRKLIPALQFFLNVPLGGDQGM